jgi:predicted Rossmann fold nucleotide-binding protein DprA/Smf involved in DNA uptake
VKLGHGFHETAQGVRYTISAQAKAEVLERLLRLNHERWQVEGITFAEVDADAPDDAEEDDVIEEEEAAAVARAEAMLARETATTKAAPRPKPQRQKQGSLLQEVPALAQDASGQGVLTQTVFQAFRPGAPPPDEPPPIAQVQAPAEPALTPNAQQVRRTLETLPKTTFDVATLSRVTRISPIEVQEALKGLVVAGLVQQSQGKYRWRG